MVLRLVSRPMLQKSNRTGPLAGPQKVLLTASLRVSLFHGFPSIREAGKLSKHFSGIPGNYRNPENLRGSKFSHEIFSSLIILAYF